MRSTAEHDATFPPTPPVPRAGPGLSVVQEGLRAGAFAAAGVAAAFAALDARLGEPLYTPRLLGHGLDLLVGPRGAALTDAGAVAAYTLVHVAAFVVLGTAVAAVVRRAGRAPSVLAGALLVFAAGEVLFAGFVALLTALSAEGAVVWPELVLGNALGWLLLGGWFAHAHPELGGAFAVALLGGDPPAGPRAGRR